MPLLSQSVCPWRDIFSVATVFILGYTYKLKVLCLKSGTCCSKVNLQKIMNTCQAFLRLTALYMQNKVRSMASFPPCIFCIIPVKLYLTNTEKHLTLDLFSMADHTVLLNVDGIITAGSGPNPFTFLVAKQQTGPFFVLRS